MLSLERHKEHFSSDSLVHNMARELSVNGSSYQEIKSSHGNEDVRMDTESEESSHMEIDQQNQRILTLCREMEQELENLTKHEDCTKSKNIDQLGQRSKQVDSKEETEPEDIEQVGARKRKQSFTNLNNGDMTFTSSPVSDAMLEEHSTCENKTICENDTPTDEESEEYPIIKESHCPYVLKTVPDIVKLDLDVLDKPIKNPSPAKARKVSILSSSVSKLSLKEVNESTSSGASASNSGQSTTSSKKEYEYIPSKRFLKPLYLKPPDTPIERPRQMIRFLEAKKKNVHYDKLHHWVLWNENLKRAHIKRNDREDVQVPSRLQAAGDKAHQAMQREEKIRRDCSRGYLPLC